MNQYVSPRSWLIIISLSAMWGSAFTFIKIAITEVGPISLVFLRLVIASIILGFLFLRKEHWNTIRKNLFHIFFIGAANIAMPFFCFAYAAKYINASSMAIVNGSTPLFAFVFSLLFLGFKFRVNQLFGITIGIVGLVIFVGSESLEFNLFPLMLAMLGAGLYGVSMVYMYKYEVLEAKQMSAVTMIAATILISPFLLTESISINIYDYKIIGSIVFLGVFCTGLAYIPYYTLVKRIGPISTSILAMLVPIFGMLWAYIFLQEEITLSMITGCMLIIFGVLLTNLIGNNKTNEEISKI
jgi:drug/metabolite transporter (DMT)-like permease|tara:strand:+ start:1154 stop:2047 length:894 start_codon:yes stop_codon:yes gene_type:complete